MKVAAAMLCDFAQVRDGLLTVVSAGVTRIFADQMPASLTVFLALQVALSDEESRLPHEIEVRITGPSAQEIATARGGFQVGSIAEVDEETIASLPFDFRAAAVPEFGWYTWTIAIDSVSVAQLRARVERRTTTASPSRSGSPKPH